MRTTERPERGVSTTVTVQTPRVDPLIADPAKTQWRRPVEMLIRIVPWDRRGMARLTAPAIWAAESTRPTRRTRERGDATGELRCATDVVLVDLTVVDGSDGGVGAVVVTGLAVVVLDGGAVVVETDSGAVDCDTGTVTGTVDVVVVVVVLVVVVVVVVVVLGFTASPATATALVRVEVLPNPN